MAVRVLFYCMVLFAGMMVFLIVKEPYRIKEVGVDGRLVPDIELFNARSYQIKEGSVDGVVYSRRVARYGDVDRLYEIDAKHKTKEGLKGSIVSDEAILKNKVIDFMTNSRYRREDGIGLDGESIRYDTDKGILSSQKPFVFLQSQSRTNGLSFVYQMKEGTISANTIHSVINIEKKTGKKSQ